MLIDEKIDELQNLTQRRITYEELAKIFNVTRSAIQNRISRKSPLKEFEIKKIDEVFKIKPVGSDTKQEETVVLDYYPDMFGSCGNGVFALSSVKERLIVPKKAFFTRFSPVKQYSVINAYGDSMQPFIFDKDKLIVEHWEGEQIIDNRPYIFSYKDEIFIKRLVKNINQLVIIPENKLYDTIKLSGEELKEVSIIGQIVGLMRDLR